MFFHEKGVFWQRVNIWSSNNVQMIFFCCSLISLEKARASPFTFNKLECQTRRRDWKNMSLSISNLFVILIEVNSQDDFVIVHRQEQITPLLCQSPPLLPMSPSANQASSHTSETQRWCQPTPFLLWRIAMNAIFLPTWEAWSMRIITRTRRFLFCLIDKMICTRILPSIRN